MNEHTDENDPATWGVMKWIPARMGQTFVLTIQIGLCVAKPESAASIRFGGQHGPSKSR